MLPHEPPPKTEILLDLIFFIIIDLILIMFSGLIYQIIRHYQKVMVEVISFDYMLVIFIIA